MHVFSAGRVGSFGEGFRVADRRGFQVIMSLIERLFRPGRPAGWSAVEATAEGLFGVSVAPPESPGGKPRVMACADLPGMVLEAPALEALAQKLGALDAAWTMPLERKTYTILVIEEPAVRPEEMAESVRWAINTMIDFPVAEASVAWMRIPTEKLLPNRAPHIYVMATKQQLVRQYEEAFETARLRLRAVDVQETAQRNIAALCAKEGEGVALLSVGHRGVQLTITFGGELYLDRHVDEFVFGDGADEAVVDRALERVVLQVQRSLDFVGRTLPFIDIQRLLLAPLPGDSPLLERITENLPVAVEALNLDSVFDFSHTPQLRDGVAQANYFVALGSALRFMEGAA